MSSLNDRQLVNSYQSGNESAFEELLKRYKRRVYAKISLYVKDKALADDIFQDTFMKAIAALKDGLYNEEGKFSAWLVRIAHNLCIDHFRANKKMPRAKGNDEFDPLDNVKTTEKNFEEFSNDAQVLVDMKKLLTYLPQEQRQIVMMRLYYDMSFREIAEYLNISINTALGRMRYALINLRKLIDKNKMHVILSQ